MARIALLDLGVADLLTLGNGLMGLLAIITLTIPNTGYFDALRAGLSDEAIAALFIAIGAVLDGLDGIVASRLGGSEMGGDLDSLSDLITFVLAPAVMTLQAFRPIHPLTAIVVAATILVFGQVRLARFNASPEHEARDFTGLPSPVAAAGIVLLIVTRGVTHLPAAVVLGGVALLAFAMVSTVPYPKARRRARSLVAGLLLLGAGVVAGLLLRPDLQEPILTVTLALTLLIIAFGPITWVRVRRRERGGRARRHAEDAEEPELGREAP
ncbi:MAG: CDP-alcohol phosphatidyltransferase family protein [Halobacteriales archaeon]|nr:CDP-alcohol phosphatidyltransferase family protein [Halobacteriales archaeon]